LESFLRVNFGKRHKGNAHLVAGLICFDKGNVFSG
jgi:hypothetical protein